MLKIAGWAALALGAALATGAHAASLLQNGDFEGGVDGVQIERFTDYDTPVGWTPNLAFVLTFDVTNGASPAAAHSGTEGLFINHAGAGNPAALTQDFTDVSRESYTVDFWAQSTSDASGPAGPDPGWLAIAVGSSSSPSTSAGLLLPLEAGPFAEYSFTFVGSGLDTFFIFDQTDKTDLSLDDITITDNGRVGGVPEPVSWVLMILGFGGIGAALRRRPHRVAAA